MNNTGKVWTSLLLSSVRHAFVIVVNNHALGV